MIVGAGVLEAVDHAALFRRGHHGGGFEALLLLLLEPGWIKEVQAIACADLTVEQLLKAHQAALRLGVGDAHGVLGRVAVAQARAPADLDKGGEAGEQHVDLALVQVPDVQRTVHVLVGRVDLQGREPFLPERAQVSKGGVCPGFVIAGARIGNGLAPACAQIEQDALFLAGLEDQLLLQRAAGIAAQFRGAGKLSLLHGDGVALGMVDADESVAHAVKAVGLKIAGEELPAVLFVMGFKEHGAVLLVGAAGVEAHLEILIVHGDMVEGEFHIAVHADLPHAVRGVADAHVKDLHRVAVVLFPGDEQGLLCLDALVLTFVGGIAQTVAADVPGLLQGEPGGLPAHRPVLARRIIPQVDIVSREVHGHAVGAEPGDAMVFGAVQPAVAAGIVGQHCTHPLGAQVVGHGEGHVHPVDHILTGLVVKIAVAHISFLQRSG